MKYKKNDIIKVSLSGHKYHFYEEIKLIEIFPVKIAYQDLKEIIEKYANDLYKDDTYKVFSIKNIRKIT